MKDAPDFAVLQFHAGPPYEVTRPHPVLVGVVKPTSHAFNFSNSRTLRSRLLTGSGSIPGSMASRVSSITIYFSSGSVSKDIATGDKKKFFSDYTTANCTPTSERWWAGHWAHGQKPEQGMRRRLVLYGWFGAI